MKLRGGSTEGGRRSVPVWAQVAGGIAIGVTVVLGGAAGLGVVGDDDSLDGRRVSDIETTSTTETEATSTTSTTEASTTTTSEAPAETTTTVEQGPPPTDPPPASAPLDERVGQLEERVDRVEEKVEQRPPAAEPTTTTTRQGPPPPPIKQCNDARGCHPQP